MSVFGETHLVRTLRSLLESGLLVQPLCPINGSRHAVSKRVARQKKILSKPELDSYHWIAEDPRSIEILRTVEKVKDTSSTLLIEGESGTGKDLLASLIHYSGNRHDRPLLRIDCSSIPAGLIESELFGYEKGAFTGAYARKFGKLEFAGDGSIILDEIVSLNLETQAKLLRVIEERRFARLGGHESLPVQARLLALCKDKLEDLVRSGTFRQDLFFRLNVIPICLPPLRERPADIRPMVEFYLELSRDKYAKPKVVMDEEAFKTIENYSFPGNVRELRNLVERLVMMTATDRITTSQLPSSVLSDKAAKKQPLSLEEVEKAYIQEILELTRGRKGRAAAILGISRKTLLEKRKRYGLMD